MSEEDASHDASCGVCGLAADGVTAKYISWTFSRMQVEMRRRGGKRGRSLAVAGHEMRKDPGERNMLLHV